MSGARTIAGLPLQNSITYIVLFVIAFGAYNLVWRSLPVMAADSPGYLETAQDLSDGHVDQLNDRAPGLPLLLVLTRSSAHPNRIFWFTSLLLYFATIWLLATLLFHAGVSTKLLNTFGVVLLLPPFLENAAYVMTENLAQFCLVLGISGVAFWIRKKSAIGLTIGALGIAYSALTRPSYQMLAPVLVASLFLLPFLFGQARFRYSQMIGPAVVLVMTSVLLIGGFSYLNYHKFGYFGITPSLDIHIGTKTIPYFERLPDEYADIRETLIAARDKELVKRGSSHTALAATWDADLEIARKTGLPKAERSKLMLRIYLLLIRQAPLEYLRDVTRAFGTYWLPSAQKLANMNSRAVQLVWVIVHFTIFGLWALQTLVLTGVSAYELSRRFIGKAKEPLNRLWDSNSAVVPYMLTACIVFYTMLITCLVDVGDPRQRTADALIVFMTVLGVHVWLRALRAPDASIDAASPAPEG